jgi:hypothetical protein
MATKKLTVEIELSEEEAERFEHYIERGCYDTGKLLGKWIVEILDKIEEYYRENRRD